MKWIAPSERDLASNTLEKRLWEAADEFRANSGLTAAEYSQPILGLIFLRFAEAKFLRRRAELEAAGGSSRRGPQTENPIEYRKHGVPFLTPEARYETLLTLPEGTDVGGRINEAMRKVEETNEEVNGVLPKTYQIFPSTLLKSVLKKLAEIPLSLDYDAFGRIYEYFLGEFARTEGSKGGEFYTPAPIVRLLAEVLEPYHGRVLDPACGGGGMFVQDASFVAAHKKDPSRALSIHGVEKTEATGRLCKMNLAVHGLEGDIRYGQEVNSYYSDPHKAVGGFDFVQANPPFNVNAVDKDRLKDAVGKGKRFPFGLPKTDNANYLWIQLFYSSLNDKGRAGFVMANSASDARSSEQEIRQQLIQARAVDVMVAVGPNMFYTVTLPCTLWFLDRGKVGTERENKVLFLDARHIFRQIDRAHRDWTPAQIGFLANVVRLYRGETPDYTLGGGEAKAKIEALFCPGAEFGEPQTGNPPRYRDVLGLCKAATLADIEAQGWSLNPGRYVGVAPGEEVSDEDFKERLSALNEELETLNAQARELEATISINVAGLLEA